LSQFITLIWLKWKLLVNSLRSSKAIANRLASILGLLAALTFGLLIAVGLGFAAYALTSPESGLQGLRNGTAEGEAGIPSAELIFFSIFTLCFVFWAILPLSIGSNKQFDPGNLLLYPISFGKLFAADLISEFASLQSVFAIPAIIAMGIGAGLAQNNLARGIVVAVLAAMFGIALSKWISTSIGALIRKKRSRGETLLALLGVAAGIGGALFGQIAPMLFRHAQWIDALVWTPPGAIASGLTYGLHAFHGPDYLLAILVLCIYTTVLIITTYWLSHRSVLGGGSRLKRKRKPVETSAQISGGWQIPFASPQLSAVLEKEFRYIMRNAQIRMMTLMPLILIVFRLLREQRVDDSGFRNGHSKLGGDFFIYGSGLMVTGGVLYVFLILAGISCNQFAFEGAGMRTLILSPIKRKVILLGKNIAVTTLAFLFSAGLLIVNEIVFRDITAGSLLFAVLSFLAIAPLMSVIGNSLSVGFPKRMKFGKRLNVSGVVGWLLIPMIVLLALPPLAAVAAGYIAQNLAILTALSFGFYALMIGAQGESLQRKEVQLLEAVNDPGSD
jgi:hypothetical protein